MATNDIYPAVYVDQVGPPVDAAWLNDIAAAIWGAIGTGRAGTPPTTPAQVLANLGLQGLSAYAINYGVDVGPVNAPAITLTNPPGAYAAGQMYIVKMSYTNTAASPTFNVNSLGAKTLYFSDGVALSPGTLIANQAYVFIYNGAGFNVVMYDSSTPSSFRNLLINGDFRIDQRNEGAAQTISTPVVYTTDRWYASASVSNCTGQRIAGTSPDQYQYQVTGTGTGVFTLAQRIELASCDDVFGGQATLSCKLATSNSLTVIWSILAPISGTDNWGGGVTTLASGSFTTSPAMTRQVVYGINIPATNFTGLAVQFVAMMGTGSTLNIADVQFERGAVANPFDRRPLVAELAMCQRYYEKSFPPGTAPAQNAGGNGFNFPQTVAAGSPHRGQEAPFRVTKRALPGIVTTYNPSAANANARNLQRANDATVTSYAADCGGISFTINGSTSSVAGDQNQIHWSVDAEL